MKDISFNSNVTGSHYKLYLGDAPDDAGGGKVLTWFRGRHDVGGVSILITKEMQESAMTVDYLAEKLSGGARRWPNQDDILEIGRTLEMLEIVEEFLE